MLKSQLPTPSTLASHHIDSSDKFKVIFQSKETDIRTYFLIHATSETFDPDLMIRSRGFLAIYFKDRAKDESFSFRMVPEKSMKKIATLNLTKEKARENHISQDFKKKIGSPISHVFSILVVKQSTRNVILDEIQILHTPIYMKFGLLSIWSLETHTTCRHYIDVQYRHKVNRPHMQYQKVFFDSRLIWNVSIKNLLSQQEQKLIWC